MKNERKFKAIYCIVWIAYVITGGLLLERFDALGRWADSEEGYPKRDLVTLGRHTGTVLIAVLNPYLLWIPLERRMAKALKSE